MKKPTSVDLFAGAGGLSLGLEMAGWDTKVAADFDPQACETYRRNFSKAKVMQGDIRRVDWLPLRGKIDLVAGGPPCQPFSVAGGQMAAADDRDMLPEFVRAVREIQPKVFLMENVAGLASSRHIDYLREKILLLAALGYQVDFRVLNAAHFGVPQDRQRVIVIGTSNGNPIYPSITHGSKRRPFYTAGEAIDAALEDEPNRAIVTFAKSPVLRPSPWAGMLVNGGGRPIDLSQPSQTIPASAGGNRTHIVDEKGILLEYHSHLIAGGAPSVGIVEGVRRLTVRESASLQSFPSRFEFSGRTSAQYRQIGNAVPPLLARAIGKSLIRSLK
jgi:DNA (cytosine-5)-methyltransferase 1